MSDHLHPQSRKSDCQGNNHQCFHRWKDGPTRESDRLRLLNRCCYPSCCIQRALPPPSRLYSCEVVQNLDTVTKNCYPHEVRYCDLKDGEWSSADCFGPGENLARERYSELLRENYKKEIEVLKTKLNLIKSSIDGSRSRQRSESESMELVKRVPPKRARDISPPILDRQPRSVHRSLHKPRSDFKRETRSMSPRHLQNSRLPTITLAGNRSSCLPYQEKNILESSEDEKSNFEEYFSASDESLDNLSEDGYSLSEDCPKLETTASSSNAEVPQSAPSFTYQIPIRASLFSNVPPYIKFSSHDEKGPPMPLEIAKLLKWKLSTITPIVIRRTLHNSGFRMIRKSNDWVGQWGKHMNSFLFKTLKDFQKLNHFPGTFHIGRKDKLWKNLNRLMLKFGKKEFGFIPTSYVLPQDYKHLRIAWEKTGGKGQWIVKPPAAARGTGIRVIHRWSDVPKNKPTIVQKYISQPYLINGSKFDLRLYVLMTSIHPLRIYLFDDGLVRFASVKYSANVESLGDRFMHLTNYSINKLSNLYCANEDASSCQGHKWTLKSLWSFLEKEGINVTVLRKSLEDLVIKTILSGEAPIQSLAKNNLPSRYCSYELFGIDVLLDSNLKPWLLEVNISPSLHSSSPLDLAVKGPLVKELFNLVGFQIPAKLAEDQQSSFLSACNLEGKTTNFCYDKRLYTTTLSRDERIKQASFNALSRSEYLTSILDALTPDDVRHLIQFEDELTQLQRFQKLFPTPETYRYLQFLDTPRYYNMLLDTWENRYHDDRSAGIHLLESLCRNNVHLEVPFPGSKTKISASQRSPDPVEETEQGSIEKNAKESKRRKTKFLGRNGIRLPVPIRNRLRMTAEPFLQLPRTCRQETSSTSQLPVINVATNS